MGHALPASNRAVDESQLLGKWRTYELVHDGSDST